MRKNNPYDNINNRMNTNMNAGNKFNNMQQNNFINQQQQMYIQNMQKMQQMQQMGMNPMQNNNAMMFGQPQQKQKVIDNLEIINKIKSILKQTPFGDERREILGETLFYFLLHFIKSYSLNTSSGLFDDATLCSKLTGILINLDESDLVEILGNNEILNGTVKDVTRVKFKFKFSN